jgi:hypothetical protein
LQKQALQQAAFLLIQQLPNGLIPNNLTQQNRLLLQVGNSMDCYANTAP